MERFHRQDKLAKNTRVDIAPSGNGTVRVSDETGTIGTDNEREPDTKCNKKGVLNELSCAVLCCAILICFGQTGL